MAPRRTAVKTAQDAAAEFDFEAFLTTFTRPEFKASLIRRTDLAPELMTRVKVLDELDESIDRLERAEGDDPERDITEINSLAKLTARRQVLTEEYNTLAETYNASAVEFTFRVPDKAGDNLKIQALMDEVGVSQPDRPDTEGLPEDEAAAISKEFETEFEKWWEVLAIRSMSVTCTSHPGTAMGAPPLTVEQWETLRDRVGPASFNSLSNAWFQAVQAAVPSAPFSPRPLPTLTTESP